MELHPSGLLCLLVQIASFLDEHIIFRSFIIEIIETSNDFQCLPRFVLASSDFHENKQNRVPHISCSTAKVLQLLLEPQHPELLDLNRDAWPTALAVDLWRCSPLHRAAERGRSEVPAILRGMLLGEDCLIYKWDVSIVQ